MFSDVELLRNVVVFEKDLDQGELFSERCIVTQLLKRLSYEKSSEEEGCFLTVTRVKRIGKGQAMGGCGHVIFPVTFTCRTFMPLPGEILQGVVHCVTRFGVFMSVGPVKLAFIPVQKMPGYHYVAEEAPFFLNNELSKIEIDVVVQFVVLDVRWRDRGNQRKELRMLASLDGDNLGPISSCEL